MESETDALVVIEELRKVPGVAGANVEYSTGVASVTFDPATRVAATPATSTASGTKTASPR